MMTSTGSSLIDPIIVTGNDRLRVSIDLPNDKKLEKWVQLASARKTTTGPGKRATRRRCAPAHSLTAKFSTGSTISDPELSGRQC
ncbi:MAG: hypothetical protein ACPGR8_16395, partial [Limisphaerales bacterium]